MKKFSQLKTGLVIVVMGLSITAFSQDETIRKLQNEAVRTIKKEEADTALKLWRKGGVVNIKGIKGP